MWQKQSETNGKRIYRSETSECIQNKCYTDKEGNNWWEFENLATIPFTRRFAATKISSLYTYGLTPEDISLFFTKHKATLRAKDEGEKYELAYAEVLDFESKFKATDPIYQMSSLVCIYFTINDEPIDSFSDVFQIPKLSLLEADPQMHAFFLERQIAPIEKLLSSLA